MLAFPEPDIREKKDQPVSAETESASIDRVRQKIGWRQRKSDIRSRIKSRSGSCAKRKFVLNKKWQHKQFYKHLNTHKNKLQLKK